MIPYDHPAEGPRRVRKADNMKAFIISIGDELLSGMTVDTNFPYLARRMGELGISVVAHATIGDDQSTITHAITSGAQRAEVILITGGLGPTPDDLTRQGLADALGMELVLDAKRLAEIESFFRTRSRTMQPSNRIQAMIPTGATSIPNPLGTAPGIVARLGSSDVYALPGVPHEMQKMFEQSVAPHLCGPSGRVVHRQLHCFGQGESDIAAQIADLMQRGRNPAVGTTADAGSVTIRVAAAGPDGPRARDLADGAVAEISKRLGPLVVGTDGRALPAVVGELLRRDRATLATAESCTGGWIAQLITSVPGSSDYYRGGVTAYADDAKRDLLAVPAELLQAHGAVSEPVAAAMAEGARRRLAADWGLSATGIAGPTGGSEDKPVGLVYLGLAGPAGTTVHRHVVPDLREIIRLRAAQTALNHLRLALME